MAYKTFANGFPLPASDLNNYLMNQSVIVFADSTARSAALPTPTEGMITYLEDTNLVEVYNGSAWADINDNTAAIPKSTVTTAGDLIVADGASSVTRLGAGSDGSLLTVDSGSPAYLAPGTDDQVLTLASGVPTWADAAGGGGMTEIVTGGYSGVLSITSIPSTFKHLQLVLSNASFTGTSQVILRLNSDTAYNYVFKAESYSGGFTYGGPQDYLAVTNSSIPSAEPFNSIINIFDYAKTTGVVPLNGVTTGVDSGGNRFADRFWGGYTRSAAISGISIIFASGDAGTYTLYGVN